MKQIYIFALLLMGILSGCGSNQKDTKEETQRMFQLESVAENSSLQRMQVSRINQEIACKGKKFQLSMSLFTCGSFSSGVRSMDNWNFFPLQAIS